MYLSCCAWALTAHPKDVLSDMRSLGFRRIDIRPDFLDEEEVPALLEHAFLERLFDSSLLRRTG